MAYIHVPQMVTIDLIILPVCRITCLACEYDASCAAFTTIARPIVGRAPRQSVNKPSSLAIRKIASNAFL